MLAMCGGGLLEFGLHAVMDVGDVGERSELCKRAKRAQLV